jgi:hypothetical protein
VTHVSDKGASIRTYRVTHTMATISDPVAAVHGVGFDKDTAAAYRNGDSSSEEITLKREVYDSSLIDPVLAKKMALVNNAIDEIGMTPFQWKLFFFNGFGYAVDSVCIRRPSPSDLC